MDDLYVGLPDYAFYIDLPDYKWETVLDSSKYLFFLYTWKVEKYHCWKLLYGGPCSEVNCNNNSYEIRSWKYHETYFALNKVRLWIL